MFSKERLVSDYNENNIYYPDSYFDCRNQDHFMRNLVFPLSNSYLMIFPLSNSYRPNNFNQRFTHYAGLAPNTENRTKSYKIRNKKKLHVSKVRISGLYL